MTSSSGPSGPSPGELERQAQGYYESYSKWVEDAETKRDKSLSTTQASFAVQGVELDNPIYQSAIDRINTGYEDTIREIEAGQTFQSLNTYYEDTIRQGVDKIEARIGEDIDEFATPVSASDLAAGNQEIAKIRGQSFQDFYSKFDTGGLSEIEQKKEVQDASRSEAQRAAAGSGVDGKRQRAQGTGASEESPWW